jgi:hypothetical protein
MSISFARYSIGLFLLASKSRSKLIHLVVESKGTMKIIAIDPGGVTGWASFTIPMSQGQPIWSDKIKNHFSNAGQITNPDHHDELDEHLHKTKPDMIVCERFEHRTNDFSLLISCEYIGVVKRYAQQYEVPLFMQGANQALVFCDNAKMQMLDILIKPYQPNKDANAAKKHLVWFLIFGDQFPAIRHRLLVELKTQ